MTAISLTTPRLCPSSVDTGERGTEPVKALSGLALASYTQSRVGKTEDKNWDPFEFSLSLSQSTDVPSHGVRHRHLGALPRRRH